MALVLATAAFAQDRATLVPSPSAKNAITLHGNSTLHPFQATSTSFEIEASTTASTDVLASAASGGFASVEVKLPVKSLRSGDGGLDDNMHKTLEASRHPVITFKLETAEAASAGKLKARGTLTIAGVTRNVELLADVAHDGKRLTLKGSLELLMSQFGIKPPTMFFGAVKTDDEVRITFELNLQPAVAAAP